MRNLRFVLILSVLFLLPKSGQTFWTWLNPKPTGNSLGGVYSLDDTTVFTVGSGGVILKTTDGGTNWVFQNSGGYVNLSSVQFPGNGKTGFALGTYGLDWPGPYTIGEIKKTTNGGTTWTSCYSVSYFGFKSIHFPVDTLTGYAVGGPSELVKTTNGGTTWIALIQGSLNTVFNSVYFVSRDTGYIVDPSGKIFKTTNGGTAWDTLVSGTTTYLGSIYFPNPMTGYTVGDNGVILKTTDEGTTWARQAAGTAQSLHSVQFPADATTGYAVGDSGMILKTTNGGATWVLQNSGTTVRIYSIHFSPASKTGYAVGSGGLVLTTLDGGNTWRNLSSSFTSVGFSSVHFPKDAETGYAVGSSDTIFKTSNGGTTWTRENSGTSHPLYSVHFPTRDTGYAVGDYGTILKTENGGSSWSLRVSDTSFTLYSVHFPVDPTTGFIAGTQYPSGYGVILRTQDEGNTWQRLAPDTLLGFQGVDFPVDTKTGFIAGAYTLLKTTDGGDSWTRQTTQDVYTSIHFPVDTSVGYAVGIYYELYHWSGVVSKTTDAGASWVDVGGFGRDIFPSSVNFQDNDSGYVVCSPGLFKSSDGGSNWSQPFAPDRELRSIYFPVSDTGYAVGDGGFILKYIPDPLVGVEGGKAEIRSQGFSIRTLPNPFTKQAVISFHIINPGFVKLGVYNITGQLVKVLAKEPKPAGAYQAVWDGRNGLGQEVGSGVYFVRLDAGNYSETRKVVLIR